MTQHPTIVLTGGGSGGHITPLLSLAQELKSQEPRAIVAYIGHKGDRLGHQAMFDSVDTVNAGKFRRYHGEGLWAHLTDIKTIALNARDGLRLLTSTLAAYRLLGKIHPDVVFSKGGFVALPVGLAARLRGIPIITHDSDTVPGLTNRLISRWATVTATGMPAEYYTYPKNKINFTGVPVSALVKPVDQKTKDNFKRQLDLPVDSQVLLVAGGGHGSRSINSLILKTANQLLNKHPSLYILHLSGANHEANVGHGYNATLDETNRRRFRVLGQTNEFYKYTGVADLIISRAGATSLAEYAIQGKPAIIIPSPFLAGGHQLKNAKRLKKLDAAVILDNNVSTDELETGVDKLLTDTALRQRLIKNLSALAKPKAASDLAKIILSLARGEGRG